MALLWAPDGLLQAAVPYSYRYSYRSAAAPPCARPTVYSTVPTVPALSLFVFICCGARLCLLLLVRFRSIRPYCKTYLHCRYEYGTVVPSTVWRAVSSFDRLVHCLFPSNILFLYVLWNVVCMGMQNIGIWNILFISVLHRRSAGYIIYTHVPITTFRDYS